MMFFRKMREQMKIVVIIVVVAMAGGLLWAGGSLLFGNKNSDQVQAASVAATVNGEGISHYDLHQAFISRLQQIEQEQGRIPGIAYESVKFSALDDLIANVVIIQEINNKKITASRKEINDELQSIIDQFPSKDDYKLQLQMVGISEDSLKAQLAEEIKLEKLIRDILSHHTVSEQELKDAYEQVKTSHILIAPENSDDESWENAKELAWDLHEQVTIDNFAELAKEHSADSSSSQGGNLGFLSRGQTIPEFEEVAFSLNVNEISEPVESTYGYHIITVTERLEAEGEEFENLRPKLEDIVRQDKGQEDLMLWFNEIKESADVIYIDLAMNAFAQVRKENYEDAIHYYELAIEEQPNDGYLYSSLAEVYSKLDRHEEAIAQYLKAIEIFDTDHSLHVALGELYIDADKIDEGVDALLRASELAPNDIFLQISIHGKLNHLERYEDAKIVEKRVEAYQEMMKAQDEAQEVETQDNESIDEETTE